MSNPLDAATREEIVNLTKNTCTIFTKEYLKAYAIALIKVKEEEAREKPTEWKLLQRPEDTSDLKTGWLTKEGGLFKTWKKRWFVIRYDYVVDYFEKEADAQKAKPKPKGTMGLCGYWVNANPNDGIFKRLEDLAKKMGMDVSELPKPKQYPELCFEVHHYRRRTYYIQAGNEEEKKQWVDAFQTACRWAYGLRNKDEVHKRAFNKAVHRTRWELGRWGWWSYGGNEEQILSDLIVSELEWEIMGRIYGKITGPWIIRNKIRKQVVKTLDTIVMAGVSPAWKAMDAAVTKLRPEIEPKVAEIADPLGKLKGQIIDKMKEAALSLINPILDEHVIPHLGKILTVIKSPFTECFDESYKLYDQQIEEFKKNHGNLQDYEKGFKHLDRFYHSWEMWHATQKLDVMYDPLWLLHEIFTEIRPWTLIWNAHDDVKHMIDNAFYTFEQAIVKAFEVEADKLKGDANYAAQFLDVTKAKVLEDYKTDAAVATNQFYCKIIKAIVFPPFNALVVPACKAVLEPLNDMIPDPMKQFVDILEMFDELVNGIIDGAIERVVSSA